jgi:hypothetical protein
MRKPYADAVPGERHELKLRVFREGEIIEILLVTVHRGKW